MPTPILLAIYDLYQKVNMKQNIITGIMEDIVLCLDNIASFAKRKNSLSENRI